MLCLIIAVLCSLAASAETSGTIGVGFDYVRQYDKDVERIKLSIQGSNLFYHPIPRIGIGIAYEAGYAWNIAINRNDSSAHEIPMLADGLVDFKILELLSVGVHTGIRNYMHFNDEVFSDDIGWGAGVWINFSPPLGIPLWLRLGFDYGMPLLSFYGRTVKDISLLKHRFSYGLTISWMY